MAEKQPTAYVVCRWLHGTERTNGIPGDNIPMKVFDTRREARAFVNRMNARNGKHGYSYYPVKHG